MNIAFFLTPKNEVFYVTDKMTLRQAMEKMEYHRYKSIPILDDDGRYVGVLTEGDILWQMKRNPQTCFQDTEKMSLMDLSRYWTYEPVSINADMDSLIRVAGMQSFVPVVDDAGTFIGIIKRGDILNYCYEQIKINERICS
ncbi:MAG: CBS domain-containing protein [Firmicutes bacterium]|nr:CBS domain-containing protein [Bacillota bacterium]